MKQLKLDAPFAVYFKEVMQLNMYQGRKPLASVWDSGWFAEWNLNYAAVDRVRHSLCVILERGE